MDIKFNPFKPNDFVHPGMFVGRGDELNAIERCLYQAKNENPQHFLVHGERGIGKTSLLFYVEAIAKGSVPDPSGARFNFLTVSIDFGGCQTQLDILGKIGRGLRSAVAPRNAVKEAAKDFWEWISNWEVLGVQYHKSAHEIDPEQVSEDLVAQLVQLCSADTGSIV